MENINRMEANAINGDLDAILHLMTKKNEYALKNVYYHLDDLQNSAQTDETENIMKFIKTYFKLIGENVENAPNSEDPDYLVDKQRRESRMRLKNGGKRHTKRRHTKKRKHTKRRHTKKSRYTRRR